jgi:tetratricopeptide (TPR) repeat protein
MARILGLLVFFLSFSASAHAEEPDLAGSYYHFSLAKMHEFNQNYGEAITEFEAALSENPEDAALRTEFAGTLLQAGQVARAVEQCEKAVELDPSYAEAHYVLGRIYYGSREQPRMREKALAEFERVVELDPNHVRALQDAAELHWANRDFSRAAELFGRLRKFNPDSIQIYYLEAQALIGENKNDEAVEVLEEGLKVRTDVPEYLLLLGGLYERREEPKKAIEIYRAGLVQNSDQRLSRALSGALVSAGEGQEAIDLLVALIPQLPEDTDLKRDLARAYRQNNQLREAADVLEEVLAELPRDVEANYELAGILSTIGEAERAADTYRVLIDMRSPEARRHRDVFKTNLAFLYEEDGRYDEAIELLREVWLNSGQDVDSSLRLCYAYREAGLFDKALELSQKLLEENPKDSFIVVARGQALAGAGRLAEVDGLLRDRFDDASDPEILFIGGSQIYMTHGEMEPAQQLIEEGLEQYPESEKIRFQLGAVFERKKDYGAAERVFKELLQSDPDQADVLNYIGYMLAELGVRLDEALEYTQRAVELDPYNGAYLDSLGWVHYMRGDLDQAELYLKRAANLNRGDAVILEHLGDLYVKKGDPGEASKYYERSMNLAEKDEDLERVKKKLAELQVAMADN